MFQEYTTDVTTLRTNESVATLIALIRQLVDFTAWRFGRVQGKSVVGFACSPGSDRDAEIKHFYECYRRQQRRIDPREIAVVQDTQHANAATMTLTLPDGTDALVILLRDEAAGPFTEYEYSLLALAKTLSEECLASSFVADEASESTAAIMQRSKPMLFILDRSYHVVVGHRREPGDEPGLTDFSAQLVDRLPKVIEDAVRRLTADWALDPTRPVNAIVVPLPFLSVRVHGMNGAKEQYLAVTIERMRRRNVLLRAAKRFLITPRERQVAAYLLDGLRIDQIGERLTISTSTVNDHVKKLLERTGAANRSQMLARLLGWLSQTAPRHSDAD